MNPATEPIDDVLPEPVVELIHEQRGHSAPGRRASREEQWRAALQARRQRGRRGAWAAMAVATSVAAASVIAAGRHAPHALQVFVIGAHIVGDGSIEAEAGLEPHLHFSDGTDVRLSGRAHAALRHIDESGATVAVRDGDAEVDVTHRPGARWMFEAGPFVIHVTGTAFRFAWNAASEEFDLRMQRGTVQVSGPLTDGALALRAGEHLVVSVRRGEALIREHDGDDAPEGAPSDIGVPGVAGLASAYAPRQLALGDDGGPGETPVREAKRGGVPATSPHGPAPTPRPDNVGEPWPALVASGAFDAILADAHRHGLDAALAHAGPQDLAALADAARYTRNDDVARQALLAQRRRFPNTTPANEAAFLLGRLAETQNDTATAVDWFRRYVTEDSGGRYIGEALGRTMILLRVQSRDGARAVAEDYLRRFPTGAYAARARAVAAGP